MPKNLVTYMALQCTIKIVRTSEFEQWLIVQSARTQALIEGRLFRLEYFAHIGDYKSLGEGCYELRFKNGLRIYLTYLSDNYILILHGGNKNGQKEILKDQKSLSKNTPKRKLKAKVLTISSAKRLSDKNLIFESLWECLIDEDLDSFKEILKSHIDAIGVTELSKNSKTSKRTMYRTLSTDGNPTLKSISRILNALWG